jgi:hypothetical protein
VHGSADVAHPPVTCNGCGQRQRLIQRSTVVLTTNTDLSIEQEPTPRSGNLPGMDLGSPGS